MNCAKCEAGISDYLEGALSSEDCGAMDSHLAACPACRDLVSGVREITAWGRSFPVYEAPVWLAARIAANTPRAVRETWLDTLATAARWMTQPRTAVAIFTATVVIGWLGSVMCVTPRLKAVAQDPRVVYYGAAGIVTRMVDGAIRRYYQTPLVIELQSQTERLREISQ